jgi:hypothetical protein
MRRAARRLLPVALAAALLGVAVTTASAATTSGGWRWTSHNADVAAGLSCPSTGLCVGVDGNKVTWTTNPTAAKPAFHRLALEPATSSTGSVSLDAVSCASARFCVVVDDLGKVFTTTTPTRGKKAWHVSDSGAGTSLAAVACASTSLCEVLDYHGAALVTTDPLAASPTWTTTALDASNGAFPVGASCVGTSVCAAVFDDAKIYYTLNAGATPATWHHVRLAGHGWDGVSCPTVSKCVAVGALNSGSRVAVTTRLAGGAKTWKAVTLPRRSASGTGLTAVSCAAKASCFALGSSFSRSSVAKPAAWHPTTAAKGQTLNDVSCPTTAWCFIGTATGKLIAGRF